MNASGAVLVLAGVWVLAQVLGGDALRRLHIVGGSDTPPPVVAGSPGTGTVEPPGPGPRQIPR